ncbi:hypothetical protein J6590_047322 [Homalodisca vitripennis]|nr:hypothetical protein J6590_047322 [Homalodisca vitripennis]
MGDLTRCNGLFASAIQIHSVNFQHGLIGTESPPIYPLLCAYGSEMHSNVILPPSDKNNQPRTRRRIQTISVPRDTTVHKCQLASEWDSKEQAVRVL